MIELLSSVDLTETPQAGAFLDVLLPHASDDLAFVYDGRRIRPGYHVTETKAASYQTLDCGGNPESWSEVIVQLWDVDGKPDQPTMTVRKFTSIYRTSASRLPLDLNAPLVFECGPHDAAAGRYTATSIYSDDGGAVVVELSPLATSCKPQDRWQEAERARTGAPPPASCC